MRPSLLLIGLVLVLVSIQIGSAQALFCNDVWVDVEDIEAQEGKDGQYFFFPVYNDEVEDFTVFDAEAWRQDGSFDIETWDWPSVIEAGDREYLQIRVDSDSVSQDDLGRAYIELRGEFEEGKYCSGNDIGRFYFDVTVLEDDDEARCSEIGINVSSVHIGEDDSKIVSFSIDNDSDEDFDLQEIGLDEDSSYFDASLYRKPAQIRAGERETFKVRVESNSVSSDKSGRVDVQLRGEFDSGPDCSFNDIPEESFTVYVDNGSGPGQGECSSIFIDVHDIEIEEKDTRAFTFTIGNRSEKDFDLADIEVEENSSYFDASLYRKPGTVYAEDSAEFKVRIRSESVSFDRHDDVLVRAKGRFDGGSSCYYDDIGEAEFEAMVEDRGFGDDDDDEGQCSDIRLNSSTVRVEQGETVFRKIYLENDSDETFVVDFVSIFDSSKHFRAEESGYGKTVPGFGSAYINARIEAYENAELVKGDAFVEVRGHFQDRDSCQAFSQGIESFPVILEEKTDYGFKPEPVPGSCSNFALIAPASKSIERDGTVSVTIDNRTAGRASVSLYGPGLVVEPRLVSVPKFTRVTENVYLSSVLPETTLFYSISALGCNRTESTAVLADLGQEQGEEEDDGPVEEEDFLNVVSSGLFVLGTGAAVIGLAIVIVLVAYIILKP